MAISTFNVAALVALLLAGPAGGARVGDGWGVNIHFRSASPREIELVAGAFRITRMDFTWADIETTCGTYDFSGYDGLLATMSAVGIRQYWIIDYTNPCYSGGAFPTDPAGIAAFTRFISASVEHFAGKNIVWECYNEPNCAQIPASNYSATFAQAIAPAKAAYPNETFAGPTVCGMDQTYIQTTLQAGLLKYWGLVSVHPYRNEPPETVLDDYAVTAAMVAQYLPPDHPPVPVISGEWGYTTPPQPGPCTGNCVRADLATQAKYLARMWLMNTFHGNPISIWYDFIDDGPRTPDAEYNFGTLFQNSDPKPAYRAAATAQWSVGNGTFTQRLQPAIVPSDGVTVTDYDVFILQFDGVTADGPAFAAWTNVTTCTAPTTPRTDCGYDGISEDECLARGCCFDEVEQNATNPQCYFGTAPAIVTYPVSTPSKSQCFAAFDYLGQSLKPICASGGTLAVGLTDGPVYLLATASERQPDDQRQVNGA